MKGLIRFIFFGNYFYGICVIALSIETLLQQQSSLNSLSYYVLAFTGTVLYYTYAYKAEPSIGSENKRAFWYLKHKKTVQYSQKSLLLIFLLAFLYFIIVNRIPFSNMDLPHWLLLLLFPFIAIFYYVNMSTKMGIHSFRNNGWSKPFIIGLVWSGTVTLYPHFFLNIETNTPFFVLSTLWVLFVNNFLFISTICIMFDIKDYATDHNQPLQTFVVRYGLRRTIFYILIPLSLIGLASIIGYGIFHNFPLLRVLINIVPYVLLIIVAYSLHRRKSILYYLAIIDGLMLAKAICGMIGITLIK